jgi:Tripartite tricarboxylate transporter TctB family
MPADDNGLGSDLVARVVNSEWIPPGLFFIALGFAALWVSRDYPVGDLNRMGPGFFPRLLSFGMIALGAISVMRGLPELTGANGNRARFDRSMWMIPASMAVFGLSVEPLGLLIALALAIAVAGAAHHQARLKEVAVSLVFLIALSVLIFVVVLGLPLRLWPDL